VSDTSPYDQAQGSEKGSRSRSGRRRRCCLSLCLSALRRGRQAQSPQLADRRRVPLVESNDVGRYDVELYTQLLEYFIFSRSSSKQRRALTKVGNTNMKATDASSPTLPHLAGVTWRLDVPRASRSSAAAPQSLTEGPSPVYSVRLSLAHVHPTPFSATAKGTNNNGGEAAAAAGDDQQQQQQQQSAATKQATVQAKLEDVSFSSTPETLLALAEAIEAAVKQSEQAPYRRIHRLIR
jgi:hypothetical protein